LIRMSIFLDLPDRWHNLECLGFVLLCRLQEQHGVGMAGS